MQTHLKPYFFFFLIIKKLRNNFKKCLLGAGKIWKNFAPFWIFRVLRAIRGQKTFHVSLFTKKIVSLQIFLNTDEF